MTSQINPEKSWSVQEAKARFSELLDVCSEQGPQLVTKRGVDAAVLVPIEEWLRIQRAARPTLKELLLSDSPRGISPFYLEVPATGGPLLL